MFVRVANHGADPGQSRDLLGRALRVASRNDDFCERILPPHPTNRGPSIRIPRIRHRAGVQNNKIGLSRSGASQAAGFELALEGRAVSLIGTATEILDVVGWHSTIVTHFHRKASVVGLAILTIQKISDCFPACLVGFPFRFARQRILRRLGGGLCRVPGTALRALIGETRLVGPQLELL